MMETNNNYNSMINNEQEEENNNSPLIKSIYGIIGGIQSIFHIISGFCDIFYLIKEFKIYVIDNIFKAIKAIIHFLKYLLTFQFINCKFGKLIANIINSFGISLCLILLILSKKEKEDHLNKLVNEEKSQINKYINSKD